MSQDVRAALALILGGACLTGSQAIIKSISGELPDTVLVLFRQFFGLICFAPIVLPDLRRFRTQAVFGHLWRTAFGISAFYALVIALGYLRLGDTVALSFTTPFWAAALAAIFFRERMGWQRAAATALGFLGVLLIAKPGGAGFHWAMLFALASAVLTSAAFFTVKRLSKTEAPVVISFYFMFFGALFFVPPALVQWQWPAGGQWPALAAIGVLSFFGQLLITYGFSKGTFTKMAPMDFVRLPISVVIGLLAFHELPDGWSLLGMATIGVAAYFIVLGAASKRAAR